MKPLLKRPTNERLLIGARLEFQVNLDHELVRLTQVINWNALEADFGCFYVPGIGRPAIPIRLMAGLQLLKHTFGPFGRAGGAWMGRGPLLAVFLRRGVLPPQAADQPFPDDPVGAADRGKGSERKLQLTIEAGKATKTVTERSFEKVIAGTTAQPKVIPHPTDARLVRTRDHLHMGRVKHSLMRFRAFALQFANAFLDHARSQWFCLGP